jgi:hypothetical protein
MLTYVTLDHANGGIVRTLTHDGITVQAVTSVRPRQQLRVRFELRYPRLRVDTRGEVVWATFAGRCGIRFLNLPRKTIRQIDEWIFGNLLEGLSLPADLEASIFAGHGLGSPGGDAPASAQAAAASGGMNGASIGDSLVAAPDPAKIIDLPPPTPPPVEPEAEAASSTSSDVDWLAQPLSGRSLAWTVNTLVVVAALLVFALVFLSITREAPRWPGSMASGAIIAVTALYWGFFKMFGGASLGERLARLAESGLQEEGAEDNRFR